MAEVAPQLESRPLGSVKTSLTVLAALSGLVALYVRFNKIGALLSPDVPTDAPARLAKLRQLYIVCYVFSECPVLYGLALRYEGQASER